MQAICVRHRSDAHQAREFVLLTGHNLYQLTADAPKKEYGVKGIESHWGKSTSLKDDTPTLAALDIDKDAAKEVCRLGEMLKETPLHEGGRPSIKTGNRHANSTTIARADRD